MNKMQKQVREFHQKVVGGPTSPAPPKIRDAELRARLIMEEALETIVALLGSDRAYCLASEAAGKLFYAKSSKPDLAGVVDGCMDLLYVTLGTVEAVGVDAEPYFDEVHRTNMLKVCEPTGDPAARAAGKKGGKPDGWRPPRIAEMLEAEAAHE